jgi:hypothetical protein
LKDNTPALKVRIQEPVMADINIRPR